MRLYLDSGKLIFAAMYLWRVSIESRCYAAAPTQVSTLVSPPAPAAHNLGVKKGGGCGDAAAASDKQLGGCAAEKMKYATLCVQWKVNPRGDIPSECWNRWP
jgi:hypothetical protein